ncbi:MAG: TetR/AcrR family transcriptional regulator [Clostridiales bacterium]|jgi:AcrR family transcriptional regulator|nr:TetR/AcrR family transcriptional regulator [Clostridiales bacterium]
MNPIFDKSAVPTRERILHAAIKLFSDNGYNSTSMRDIAAAVEIRVASIYSHYSSKEEILQAVYEFFTSNWEKACPDLNEILRFAETAHPYEVLQKVEFHYEPHIQEDMDRIMMIAARRIRYDPSSAEFAHKYVIGHLEHTLKTVLARLIELGKIEPLPIKPLTVLLCYFSFGTAVLNSTVLEIGLQAWQECMALVFSLIKPTGK